MAKFECVFPSGYSFNDILQYFHTHLTKNHGNARGAATIPLNVPGLPSGCMSDTV